MNTSNIILHQYRLSKEKTPISSIYAMPSHLSCLNRHLGRALRVIAVVAVIGLVSLLSSAALGANPAEEMAKSGATGGIDPKGNSWYSIEKSVEQFAHPTFILRLFLSLSLAVGCAFAIAWHPRRASVRDPLADFEERKALILLGVVGAVVAELSGTSQTLAFVIFGIGALDAVQSLLLSHKCKLQSSSLYEDKGRMVFLLYLPNGVDPTRLEHEVRSKLRKNQVSKITVDVI